MGCNILSVSTNLLSAHKVSANRGNGRPHQKDSTHNITCSAQLQIHPVIRTPNASWFSKKPTSNKHSTSECLKGKSQRRSAYLQSSAESLYETKDPSVHFPWEKAVPSSGWNNIPAKQGFHRHYINVTLRDVPPRGTEISKWKMNLLLKCLQSLSKVRQQDFYLHI